MSIRKNCAIILCTLYCFVEIMLSTELTYIVPSSIISIFKYIIAIISAIYLLIDCWDFKFSFKIFITVLLLFVLAVCVLFFAMSLQILMILVFSLLLRKYKFFEILKPMYLMLWVAFLLTVFLSIANIFPNIDHSRNGLVRYPLGFGTPTLGQSILLFLLLTKFYLKKNDMSYLCISLFFILIVIMYYFTAGRTGFYLSLLALLFIILYKLGYKSRCWNHFFSSKILMFGFIVLPIIFLTLSLILTKLYADGNSFAIKLNYILSTRLLLQMNAFNERAITIFGQNIEWINNENIYIGVDNSYLFNLFNYGIIVFILALCLYSYMIYRAWLNHDLCLIIIFSIILIDAILEPYLLDFKYNFFVFYFSYCIFNDRKKIKEKQIFYSKQFV